MILMKILMRVFINNEYLILLFYSSFAIIFSRLPDFVDDFWQASKFGTDIGV